jgi:hypothetical protein
MKMESTCMKEDGVPMNLGESIFIETIVNERQD